ncbi:MAG: LuxR C-terminal-related transcriptional regulator [Acidimicrobiales bacterium]
MQIPRSSQSSRLTVAIESELDIVAAGVRSLLEPFADRMVMVDRSHGQPVDVVLVDPSGRAEVDLAVLDRLARDPSVRHLALYALSLSVRTMREAQRFGVRSFLSKSLGAEALTDAITQIAAGRAVDSPGLRSGQMWLGREDGLTERESEVLVLCADGLSNREIAEQLYVNVETVKSHLKHAYSRLGLRNRAQASAYVHRTSGARLLAPVDLPRHDGDGERADRTSHEAPPVDSVTISPDELADRLLLVGLDGTGRDVLRRVAAAVNDGAEAFTDRLVERWAQLPQTAPLVADEVMATRLLGHQRAYLYQLFTGELDARHATSMLRTGATHHRIRLSPQWYPPRTCTSSAITSSCCSRRPTSRSRR